MLENYPIRRRQCTDIQHMSKNASKYPDIKQQHHIFHFTHGNTHCCCSVILKYTLKINRASRWRNPEKREFMLAISHLHYLTSGKATIFLLYKNVYSLNSRPLTRLMGGYTVTTLFLFLIHNT